jgi:alpha-galactosidase
MRHPSFLAAAFSVIAPSGAWAAGPSPAELAERDRWVSACFPELEVPARPSAGELIVEQRYDWILRNTFCAGHFAIAGRTYYRGLFAHANSRITVRLPGPGASFSAIAGIDTNFMTSGGRGSVVFGVDVGGERRFTSPVVREGASCEVSVKLDGATEFAISVSDSGDGISCDQGCWADARVELADGRTLLVGDLPIVEGQDGPPVARELPFSFTCGGRPSAELLPGWTRAAKTTRLDATRLAHTLTLTDPTTKLQIRCEAVYFTDFPTVEWTVWLTNTGDADTPLIEGLQGIDLSLQRHGKPDDISDFVLHHYRGEGLGQGSLAQEAITLKPGANARFAPPAGRGTDGEWPYYNLECWTNSVILGVGWPAQWAASFTRDDQTGLRVRAGQELTHLVLHPGESVRTPRIVLQFYDGDAARAQNIWRAWMLAHNVPHPNGSPPPPLSFGGSNRQLSEMVEANEQNQREFIDCYLKRGIRIDYWWMDAGWYVGAVEHGWPHVGTWEVDTNRFPGGLRTVSDYAHEKGLKTLVWFEPERVVPGTWIYQEHPEWLFPNPGDPNGTRLLNLGLPAAREWLTDHIDGVLTQQGIDLYRQDFNMDPLAFWRAADAEDRQGIAENLHVQGYLAYWDELKRRHPHMLIDTCASGGRRMDLETLRRAVPLWRSDHAYEVIGNQCLTYGLSQWVPYYGTGNLAFSGSYYGSGATPVVPYDFWSTCAPANGWPLDVRSPDNDYTALKALQAQRDRVIGCFDGDFYPLTPASMDPGAWVAWQFHRGDADGGVVMVFRRAASPYLAVRFPLRGLDPGATYRVTRPGAEGEQTLRGDELLHRGLRIDIDDAPGAAVFAYEKR